MHQYYALFISLLRHLSCIISVPLSLPIYLPSGKDYRVEIKFTDMTFTEGMNRPGSVDFMLVRNNITYVVSGRDICRYYKTFSSRVVVVVVKQGLNRQHTETIFYTKQAILYCSMQQHTEKFHHLCALLLKFCIL